MKFYLLAVSAILFNLGDAFYRPIGERYPKVKEVINETLEITERGGSFMVVNVDGLIDQYNRWTRLMPRVRPFYAIKANPLPIIVETLAALGTGFDCASLPEIKQILNISVHPDDIIFAHTYKTKKAIEVASVFGVKKMTFDGLAELEKTMEIFPKAQQLLRIKVNDENSQIPLGSKFGAPEEVVPQLLEAAKRLRANLIGVSFHVGSNTTKPDVYVKAIKAARKVFDQAEELGFNLSMLDIGGGFPSGYLAPEIFEKQGKKISETLDELFPKSDLRFKELKIIAEPGRYFAGDHPLVVRIYGERTDPDGEHQVFANDGIHQSFRGNEYAEKIIPTVFETGPPKQRPSVNTTIWGQTCDPKDVILKGVVMPEVHIDDVLVFEERGSYFASMASNFNGFRAAFPVVAMSRNASRYIAKLPRRDRVFEAELNTLALELIYLEEIIDLIPKRNNTVNHNKRIQAILADDKP